MLLTVFTSNSILCLVLGIFVALVFGNPYLNKISKISEKMLKLSVVLLGFNISITTIFQVGYSSIWITLISIIVTMVLGILYGRLLKTDNKISLLISSGTAICGASAVAAVSSATGASQSQTAVAFAVVFILNAAGLIIFPFLGHILDMDQVSFGLWSAISIHNTSSVAGAVAEYGDIALSVGLTAKLVRALWILPLAFVLSLITKSREKISFQWFLLFFLLAGYIASVFPEYKNIWKDMASIGKHLMAGSLFLVGSCLTLSELKRVGLRSFIMACLLWISISVISFFAITYGYWYIPVDI